MKKIEINNRTNCAVECMEAADEKIMITIGENKPKDNEYCYVDSKYRYKYIRKNGEELTYKHASLVLNLYDNTMKISNARICCYWGNYILELRLIIPEENNLLDETLKNNITRWNADKECIEDLPNKPIVNEITPVDYCEKIEEPKKEPKIGEMCIFWDELKKYAICSILQYIDTIEPYIYETIVGYIYKNCIPFESVEQYEKFIKE